MSDLINNLGINPLLLLAQIVNFLLLLFILKKFLYKPIVALLDKRAKTISDSLKRAEQVEKDAQAAQQMMDAKIAEARAESQKLVAEAKEDAERAREQIIARAESESRDIIDKGQAALRAERDQLVQDLRKETARLVIDATSTILREEMTPAKQEKYSKEVIQRLS